MAKMRVATCQFPVGGNIASNARTIERFIGEAAGRRADLVHFPECALSGYAGVDFKGWEQMDWGSLVGASRQIMELAARRRIWVILGSTHRLSGSHRPHNSLYLIDPEGKIVDRYDKRFCTHDDLKYYSPGERPVTFELGGVKCGMLICHEVRYPELYREYKRMGVEVLFHSFYNARAKGPSHHTHTIPPSLEANSASNYFWSSVANASGFYQSWPSRFILADGTVAERLRRHRSGMMINTIDTARRLRDASVEFREGAMKGVLHSGKLVKDKRSRRRTEL
jgi:predicted amidohydrolase